MRRAEILSETEAVAAEDELRSGIEDLLGSGEAYRKPQRASILPFANQPEQTDALVSETAPGDERSKIYFERWPKRYLDVMSTVPEPPPNQRRSAPSITKTSA